MLIIGFIPKAEMFEKLLKAYAIKKAPAQVWSTQVLANYIYLNNVLLGPQCIGLASNGQSRMSCEHRLLSYSRRLHVRQRFQSHQCSERYYHHYGRAESD